MEAEKTLFDIFLISAESPNEPPTKKQIELFISKFSDKKLAKVSLFIFSPNNFPLLNNPYRF